MKIIQVPFKIKEIILLCTLLFIVRIGTASNHLNEKLPDYVSARTDNPPFIAGIINGSDTIFFSATTNGSEEPSQGEIKKISYRNKNLKLFIQTASKDRQVIGLLYSVNAPLFNRIELNHPENPVIPFKKEGEYTLFIKQLYSPGTFSSPMQARFYIQPPFWRSWWAYLLYTLLLLTAFFILYRLYQLKIHKIPTESKTSSSHKLMSTDIREIPNDYAFINTGETTPEKSNKWDKYEMATVLFSDIQGFTKIAEQMNPELLIDELDRFFFHFDSVVDKYDIEKIKTIGDAYMAAGGIPTRNNTNPVEVVLAALEMQQYMKQLKTTRAEIWDLRIGIHSGPVIAGAIGSKKRSYDIWGDTVNTASRMESSGEPGKVNISEVTYNLVKDFFLCEYRGKIPVKYKGNIDMFFVTKLRPELSVNLDCMPNRKFFLKLQHVRLTDLKRYVFDKLKEEQSEKMPFHNLEYARHLYEYSIILAKSENLDLEETLIIKTASLFLSLGQTGISQNPEIKAARLAREILPEFKYTEGQINTISNILLAAKWPPEPYDLLEKIMIDIRMEYLGRADFVEVQQKLFQELTEYMQLAISPNEWINSQISLLQEHEFLTTGARRLREITSAAQIKRLLKIKN